MLLAMLKIVSLVSGGPEEGEEKLSHMKVSFIISKTTHSVYISILE